MFTNKLRIQKKNAKSSYNANFQSITSLKICIGKNYKKCHKINGSEKLHFKTIAKKFCN